MKQNLTLLVAFFTIFIFAENVFAQTPQKPNFILIVADDLGFADLSLNGSKQIPTPNIDRLAHEGITLLKAMFLPRYVARRALVCLPVNIR